MDQRITYAWTDASKSGLAAWVLVIVVEVAAAVSLLRAYPDSQVAFLVCLGIPGLSLAGGLLLLLNQFEASLEADGLSWRRRSLFDRLRNRPSAELRIPRQSISKFRLDKSPWTELKLTILLIDGSRLGIRGRAASARGDGKFESFLAAFRAFIEVEPNHRIQEGENIWRSPTRRLCIGGIVGACILLPVLIYMVGIERRDLMIVTIGAIVVGAQGVRFLLQRN
ncbi:MAG: hypothetical protein JNM30_05150 [Rhodospirillales bacterium]|nr:hypothetical protein [Rhodospirillales bacterium]